MGWGLRFEPQVRVQPLLEPEPAKRFGFKYSAEPDSRTPSLKSGSDRVRKVQDLDHGQSSGSVEMEYCEILFQLETEHSDKELYWIIVQSRPV